jgi:8-oxo-dGTP pyrophosphatase MutT (NUDIX family)
VNDLTEAMISTSLISQKDTPRPWGNSLRKAAVLIPLIQENGQWHLLFIHRTETVRTHKGQVAFPGGLVEAGDQSPEMTAARETCEEIGVSMKHIHFLGRMEDMPTSVTGFQITPVVGKIEWPVRINLSPDEVSRVFSIPLLWLSDVRHLIEKPMVFLDGRIEQVIFYEPYHGEVLWGVTARMTMKFLRSLGLINKQGE